jgi:hypothetical protein
MVKKVGCLILLVLLSLFVVSSSEDVPETLGPSAEQQQCLKECMNCKSIGVDCTGDEAVCMPKCNVEPEPQGEKEQCMSKCVTQSCEEHDFSCQEGYRGECEDKCGLIGEPEAESEEEQCIRDCVNKIDSTLICSSGKAEGEGEQGNAVCKKCAEECVYLYAGPCLTDEEWTEKEEACMSQGEHMEAAPIIGPSGEGYECTVDLECIDRSDEWGDDPGTGPASYEEGHEPSEDNVVTSVFKAIGNFFADLFNFG